MSKLLPIVLALLLLACATTATTNYRPRGSNDAAWKITSTIQQNSLTVTINDSTIVDESLGFFTGNGEFNRTYRDHSVNVIVEYVRDLLKGNYYNVLVMVDGEVAGRFQL